jgi:hypothetical protein
MGETPVLSHSNWIAVKSGGNSERASEKIPQAKGTTDFSMNRIERAGSHHSMYSIEDSHEQGIGKRDPPEKAESGKGRLCQNDVGERL